AGGLVGLVTKAELVPAVVGRVKPPVVGGMATPFGVYLTGGGVRGGVGDLALMSTGIFMCLVMIVSFQLAKFLVDAAWAQPELADLLAHLPSGNLPLSPMSISWTVLFAVLFRLCWITGYHAAEHQVVHAIEAGDDLKPEIVSQKPRVHPRCGTNLVAAANLICLFWFHRVPWLGELEPVAALLITVLYWRRVGGWLQQYVTTRPATPKQIESGIRAARQLLDRYQQRPRQQGMVRRVWNMGLLQVMAGWLLCLSLLQVVYLVFPQIPRDFSLLSW
ncbi:MAG TPA: DUF1385 domain-containing protein, partial [Armatimonadota bacterium]|nr:DUF1385 domain-containing protein [Armatimonadota bacterium]